jgi:hypothetical protein
VRQEAEGPVQQEPEDGRHGRRARGRRDYPAVEGERSPLPEHMPVVGQVTDGHGPRNHEEHRARGSAQAEQRDHSQRRGGRNHLDVQPGQERREQGGESRPGRSRGAQQQVEARRETQRRGHFRVEVERVEADRRPGRGRPGQESGGRVSREAPGHPPHLQTEQGGEERHQDHTGGPSSQGIDGSEQDREAGTVVRVRPPVEPGRPVMRRQGAGSVLPPVLAREVVLQVQVVLAPQALGHQQVVGLVARHLQAARVVETDEQVQAQRSHEQGGATRWTRPPQSHRPRERHPARQREKHDAHRPLEHSERRQGGARRRDPREQERHEAPREHGGRLPERAMDHGAAS